MSLHKLYNALVGLNKIFWSKEVDTQLEKEGYPKTPVESAPWRYLIVKRTANNKVRQGFEALKEVLRNEALREWLVENIKSPIATGQLWECLKSKDKVRIPGEPCSEDYIKSDAPYSPYEKLLVCLSHESPLSDLNHYLFQSDLASTKQNGQKAKGATAKKRYRKPVIIAALITAVATILAAVITSHGNKQGVSLHKNVSTSFNAETKGNLSPAIVTSGPNSPVNIYLTPGQSETRSEVNEMDVNQPK